jgi:thioredoxin 2
MAALPSRSTAEPGPGAGGGESATIGVDAKGNQQIVVYEPRDPGGGLSMAEIVTCSNCGKRNRLPAAATGVARCAACHTALPWLTSAGDDDFEQVVTAASLPVLVDLWAPWCGPCRVVAPGVERTAQELAGRLKAVKVNVDEAPRVAERFGVLGIPTLLVLRQGREVARQVGAVPPPALLRWVEEVIGRPAA